MVTCLFCGGPIVGRHAHARYCSDRCRWAAAKRKARTGNEDAVLRRRPKARTKARTPRRAFLDLVALVEEFRRFPIGAVTQVAESVGMDGAAVRALGDQLIALGTYMDMPTTAPAPGKIVQMRERTG